MLVCLCISMMGLAFKFNVKRPFEQEKSFFLRKWYCQTGVYGTRVGLQSKRPKKSPAPWQSMLRTFFAIVSPWETHVKRGPWSERRPVSDAKEWMVDTHDKGKGEGALLALLNREGERIPRSLLRS